MTSETDCWNIWIDTGGTFTDCLAVDPRGRMHRAKVLSSSALRGRIASQIDSRRFIIDQNWNAPDDLIRGMEFRLLGKPESGPRVVRFEAQRSILELDRDDQPIAAGALLEIRSLEPAPVLAARLATRTRAGAPLPPIRLRLATTRGTNALLERQGARVALFITEGFGDLLAIGDQQRPDLFALDIRKPQPLYDCVVEVPERIASDGSTLKPLDEQLVIQHAHHLISQGVRVAAVALLNSYANSAHERQLARLLREVGFDCVAISSEIAPLIRLLPRAHTTVVDSYLSVIINEYLQSISRSAAPDAARPSGKFSFHVMTSAGGLASAGSYRAVESLLSGPAGGVAGAAAAGRQSGFDRIIGFDMGGTSTDVARYDGDFEYRFEQIIEGRRLLAPALAIETVAAGGGSICELIHDQMVVGPRSAGAAPGPACYGAGGPLTLTDINLLLGRLNPQSFEIPISIDQAQAAADRVLAKSPSPNARVTSPAWLDGFLEIANQRMAAAIELVSVRQGYDPEDLALVAFGGAGGQHACAVAQRLGMRHIVLPADAALLSAAGLGHAVIERFAHRQILQLLQQCADQLPSWIESLSRKAIEEVTREGVAPGEVRVRRAIINLRLLGQDATLPIDLRGGAHNVDPSDLSSKNLRDRFSVQYQAVYGHAPAQETTKPLEVESIRVIASSNPTDWNPLTTSSPIIRSHHATSSVTARSYFDGEWRHVPAFQRGDLKPGARLTGPALVWDRRTSVVIEPGWNGVIDAAGALVLESRASPTINLPQAEAVRLELFSNRLTAIADEMGQMLERTAISTNVKERLDFSCAVLDAEGDLVVNAPHIPVHLGALGMCVRAVRDTLAMEDSDVVVSNHPAYGGSHLPDITVITPVFAANKSTSAIGKRATELIGYVANRAHHAEIGGTRPGSMPPSARTLHEEGVVIKPQYLVHRGQPRFDQIEKLLSGGPYPSRAVIDNLADLRAAVAANHRGAEALRRLASEYGVRETAARMDQIKARAQRLMRSALDRIGPGQFRAVEQLDDGSPICATINVQDGGATFDFSGSAPQHPGNLNATPAIVRSAVMYVLRLMIGESTTLNEGLMRPVRIVLPGGILNPTFDADPSKSPAVVGGNTETSQRIVDTLLKAFELCACSQGTMNNILFGTDRWGYYETVCGGCGAGPGFDGASAVHSHMTNTRITDPEILEHRYPVRVDRFSIRRGSGGGGRWRGGDGAIREFTFIEPMSLSVLTQHRTRQPYGICGGEPGAVGRQQVMQKADRIVELGSIDGCEVEPGDRLTVETPGGGGYGKP
ncbi:MAG: hydantoinase B/oxoprolinase family protein [Phycisphaerales bacterium]|nr:hydantoinase B/oxoprolinase family protein [Phycisphaerales bacterium]